MLFQAHKPSCEPNWNWVSSLGRRQGNSISISVWNRTQGEAVYSSLHIIHSSYILYPIRQVITEEDSRRLFETVGKCSEFVCVFFFFFGRSTYETITQSFYMFFFEMRSISISQPCPRSLTHSLSNVAIRMLRHWNPFFTCQGMDLNRPNIRTLLLRKMWRDVLLFQKFRPKTGIVRTLYTYMGILYDKRGFL